MAGPKAESLASKLRTLRRPPADLATTGKSAGWKLALAAAVKARTAATNRWLAMALHLGNLHETNGTVSAWNRQPNPALRRKLQ